jgi:aminoglycoside phosphotransferase (APT) family kinase protein
MIDERRVEQWFLEHVPGVALPLSFDLVPGGHSCLTFTVTAADGRRFALRRPPLGHTLATAHDVLREHRIISALADTEVPVAPVVAACDDIDVTGAPFYVMAFVDGVVLHDAGIAQRIGTEARRRASESMIDVMAALHAVDPDAVGLGDFAKRTDYLGRQLKRWAAQWASADTRPMPGMDELHDWLIGNQPEEGSAGIVHGDFRLGNAIHAADGSVAALLDWELSTLGPALADLSYLLRSWVEPGEVANAAMVAPSSVPGFLTRAELITRYEQATGQSVDDLSYWLAFHAWRSACITAGVFTRYKHGNMGRTPEGFEKFEDSVEQGVKAGLSAAGLS